MSAATFTKKREHIRPHVERLLLRRMYSYLRYTSALIVSPVPPPCWAFPQLYWQLLRYAS